MKSRPHFVPARSRSRALAVALAGVAVSAAGLWSAATHALPAGTPAAGTIVMNPATGNSGTTFSLQFGSPPAPQLCPGDNTTSHLWHTFVTPTSNDPASIVYTPSGTPTGEPAFTNNLANAIGTRTRNVLPGLGDGNIIQPTGLTFTNALYAGVTAGDYWVGIACTVPDNAGGAATVRFWAGLITVTVSAGAGPNNFNYSAATPPTTTTTTTTTTTVPTTTSTTVAGTTTSTTVAGATTTSTTVAGATTTVAGGATTTTTNPCPTTPSTTTTVAGTAATSTTAVMTTTTLAGSTTTAATTTNPCPPTATTTTLAASNTTRPPAAFASSGPTQGLANTGTSTQTVLIVVWGVLLLVFGRMTILMARPIKVIDH